MDYEHGEMNSAGLYIIEFSKGLEIWKEIKGGKKEKKRKFWENITFDSTKS